MAGDWIKWSKGLAARREVVLLSSLLHRDRCEIAGRLMVLWEWLDDNVADSEIDELSLDASLFVGDKPFDFISSLRRPPHVPALWPPQRNHCQDKGFGVKEEAAAESQRKGAVPSNVPHQAGQHRDQRREE
jgi:hypothetical protein